MKFSKTKFGINGTIKQQIFYSWAILITQILICFTGAIVRVTSSGLGCITWPECQPGSLVPTADATQGPLHQTIEFGNRTITFLVVTTAILGLINFIKGKRSKEILFYAWLMPLSTVVQAVIGGISVRMKLVWWTVSLHMLVSLLMVWLAALLLVKIYQKDDTALIRAVPQALRILTGLLGIVIMFVTISGTMVTAAGPHAGDLNPTHPVERLDFSIRSLAEFHSKLMILFLGLLVGLVFALIAIKAYQTFTPEITILLGTVIIEGILGFTQYFLEVPATLVVFHVLLSGVIVALTSMVWAKMRHREFIIRK